MTGLDCMLLRLYLLFMSEQMYNVYLYTYVCTCVRMDGVSSSQPWVPSIVQATELVEW